MGKKFLRSCLTLIVLTACLTSCLLDLAPNSFDVTYNYNYVEAGKSVATESKDVVVKGSTALPIFVQRDGYSLEGWYKDKECTQKYDFSKELKENIVLYAHWLKQCTVTFIYNYRDCPANYTVVVLENELTTSFPANRAGYALEGWYTEPDENLQTRSTKVDFTEAITDDVSYYAKWADAVRITYNYNDGLIPTTEERYIQKNTSAANITPERTGYTFAGWYTTDKQQTEDFKVDFSNQISEDKIFYAKWISNFKVSFNYNDVSFPTPYVVEVAYMGKVSSHTAQWNNHALVGWYTTKTPTETDTPVEFPATVTQDIEYYAQWTSNVVEVTYDLNYENKKEYKYVAHNTSAEYYKANRDGYELEGWYTVPEKSNQNENTKVEFNRLTEPVIYYAKWLKNCKVTFNYNYGDTPETYESTVKEGNKTTSYPAVRANNALEGWYTEGGTKVDFDTFVIEDDITLYANWTSTVVTVTYNYNFGTNPTIETKCILPGTTAENYKAEMSGYIFDGWYLEKELKNKATFVTLEEDITYFAKWLKNCKVTFSFNYTGSTTVYETYVKEGEKVQSYPAARSGYALDGWFKDTGTTEGNEVNFDEVINEDKIYYAKWTENLVKVTFNYNYGDNPITEESYIVKNTTAVSKTPEREGYVFAGWYTVSEENKQNEDTKADFSLQLTTNKTYFAKWLKKCKVSFDYNYSGSPVPYVTYVIQGEHATSFPASRTNYGLVGWYTVSEEAQQAETTPVDFDNEVINADVTYYARWNNNYVDITYDIYDSKTEVRRIATGTTVELFTPQREGDWQFDGWYDFGNNQEITSAPTTVSGTTYHYYAKWTKIHTVTFDYNYDNCPAVYKTKVLNNGTLSSYQASRPEYVLEGWYTDKSFTTKVDFANDKITKDTTYYANWESTNVKVTFDYNYDSKKAETYIKSGSSVAEITPSRTGYNFIGWYTTQDTSGSVVSFPKTLTTSTTYYAKWEALKYDITFDLNQGKEESSYFWDMSKPKQHEFGKSTTLPTPSIDGYTFKGWYTDVGCKTSEVEVLGATDYTKNIVLYAKWEAKQYTVTFVNEKEGATDPSMKTKVVTYGSAYGTLATTKLENWEFEWYDAQENLIDASTIVSIADDHTLYAKGVESYIKVTYDYNHDGQKKDSMFARNTTPYEEAPTRTGYVFSGWYYANEAGEMTDNKVDFAKRLTEKVTLIAKWLKNCKVTYNYGISSYSTYVVEGNKATKFDVSKTGYSLEDWYTSDTTQDNTTKVTFPATIEDDTVYYAKWKPAEYTVTLHEDNPTTNFTDLLKYNYGVGATLPTDGEKTGYTFIGWYDNSDLTGTKVTSISTKAMENKEYWAKWEANTYTVTLHANSPTTSFTSLTSYTYGSVVTLPTDGLKTGYTFTEWYAYSGFTGDAVTEISSTDIGVKEYWAKWTPNTYYVQFDGNGNTSGSMDNQEFTYDADPQSLTVNGFARTGYEFTGWSETAKGEVKYSNEASVKNLSTKDTVVLYAQWTPKQYTITYYENDGTTSFTGEPERTMPSTHTYGQATNLVLRATKTGYTFAGWYTEKECTNKVTELGSEAFTSDIKLYAKWNPDKYSIIYYDNGGIGFSATSWETGTVKFTYEYSKDNNIPIIKPLKTGYDFVGWYTESGELTHTGTGSDKSYYIEKGTTGHILLFASWTPKKYSVTFNANGGKNLSKSAITETYLSTYELPTVEPSTGYYFKGWYTAVEGGTEVTASTIVDITAEGQTLYAQWTPYYSIIYRNGKNNIEGEDNEIIDSSITQNCPQIHMYGSRTELAIPTKPGYKFGGWFTKYECEGAGLSELGAISYTADITLYAKWIPAEYVVSFDSNGGDALSADLKTRTVTYKETYGYDKGTAKSLPVPTKLGYSFSGWFTAAEGGDKIEGSSTVLIIQNTTLYAQWTANTYKVVYNGNGGKTSAQSSIFEQTGFVYDTEKTLADNQFTKPGYTFAGWANGTNSGASGYQAYAVNQSVKNLTAENDQSVQLYAVWTPKEYTVTFDNNGYGTLSTDSKKVTNDSKYGSLATCSSSYEFLGWYTQAEDGTQITENTTVSLTEDITLYAHWRVYFYVKETTYKYYCSAGTWEQRKGSIYRDGGYEEALEIKFDSSGNVWIHNFGNKWRELLEGNSNVSKNQSIIKDKVYKLGNEVDSL